MLIFDIMSFMKRILLTLVTLSLCHFVTVAAVAVTCGDGYVLVDTRRENGIQMAECQKLWCMDLENGKSMGRDERANSGYDMTKSPVEMCVGSDCIYCFGTRVWCNGEAVGRWSAQDGAWVRGGGDNWRSTQRGSCFAWTTQKPECENGQVAMMVAGRWTCAEPQKIDNTLRNSTIRRTGTIMRRP
jgi:hypothetical protein